MKKDIIKNLVKFNKVIVTGPPRSGTTISGVILSNGLNFPYIDEITYGYTSKKLFNFLNTVKNRCVIQTTLGIRKIHLLYNVFEENNIAVVLIKRDTKDILDSFENTKKFNNGVLVNPTNEIYGFSDKVLNDFKTYYEIKNDEDIPTGIYREFYSNLNGFKNFFELEYNSLKDHKLFVKKKIRRKKFWHLKQVSTDNAWLINKKVYEI